MSFRFNPTVALGMNKDTLLTPQPEMQSRLVTDAGRDIKLTLLEDFCGSLVSSDAWKY